MKLSSTEVETSVRKACLELLLEKEPVQIGMREIAQRCHISATAIHYYYADKQTLFDRIKKDCLAEMNAYIRGRTASFIESAHSDSGRKNPSSYIEQLRTGLTAFRDWCFENQRLADLIMSRLSPDDKDGESEAYYQSSMFAQHTLDKAVETGETAPCDTHKKTALIIAALWGAVESVISKRTFPDYWNKGIELTDAMIDIFLEK